MKIIKSTAWVFPFTCKSCKSELEAGTEDVRHDPRAAVGEDFYVDCAVCGACAIVPHGHLTPKVVREVEMYVGHTIPSYVHRESFLEKTLRKKTCPHTRTEPSGKIGQGRGDDRTCLDCGKTV